MALSKVMTVEDFEAFAELPENAHKRLEFIEGEIHEVASNNRSSGVGMRFGTLVGAHIITHDLGIVTGPDGGYSLGQGRYIPDFAFISKAKQNAYSADTWNRTSPDLVIEVLSPSNTRDEIEKKTNAYLAAGATTWIANPISKTIEVHAPGQPRQLLGMDDILQGGDVLPGFKIAVREIFRYV